MKLTSEMLNAAVKKAVEAGLLPRHANQVEMSVNQDLIRFILEAALESASDKSGLPGRASDLPIQRQNGSIQGEALEKPRTA